jgi:hypothetical protein
VRATLVFDINRAVGTVKAATFAAFLRGEITAREAADRMGYTRETFAQAMATLVMRAASQVSPSTVLTIDPSPSGTVRGHQHGEAFCRMKYRCGTCLREEWIWNSRDGVTPFGVDCSSPSCNGGMTHVEWHLDVYRPGYLLAEGERYFADGTVDEAQAILRRRIDKCKGTEYEVAEEDVPALLASVGSSGEFQAGWPMLRVFAGVGV